MIHSIPVSFSAIGPEIILLVTAAVLLVTMIFLPDEPARLFSAGATAADEPEDENPVGAGCGVEGACSRR